MPKKILGAAKTTESIYIGKERYAVIAECARKISHLTNFTVRPSAVVHYIIDEDISRIEEDMINRIKSVQSKANAD